MKLSTRTRYGIRAVLELAENYNSGPIQLKTIARHQGISVKYLEQLMAILKSAGIVSGLRGSKGGYILTKSPDQIRLSDCFNCLEGPVITVECVENNNFCPRTCDCIARTVWAEIQKTVMDVLQSITLQSLLDKSKPNENLHYQI
ncbi:MAG: Rrf2 family transcriptional regulator [Sedimentisphaerales bacterium]|nr:Rrf2 family transcriptional regulator [Sedimentisphaerales bacterium]